MKCVEATAFLDTLWQSGVSVAKAGFSHCVLCLSYSAYNNQSTLMADSFGGFRNQNGGFL
jgi:hypothetical protein